MKTMMLSLMFALLAAPLLAGEKEEANTNALLESLTEVKDSALGKEELRFLMLGIEVGKFTVEITKGEHEGKPCYVVTAGGAFALGEAKREVRTTGKIGPNLAIISEESSHLDDGEVVETMSWKLEGGVYKVHVTDKDAKVEADKDRKYEVKPEPTLLAGFSDLILARVLPNEAKAYAFKEWDHDSDKVYTVNVEVTPGAEGAVTVVQKSTEASKDDTGKVKEKPKTTTTSLKGGKFVRVELHNNFVLTTVAPAKRTAISAESMAKQDKEMHAVCAMFAASMDRNEEKMKLAVNLDRFADIALEKDPQAQGMSKDDLDAAKPFVKDNILKSFLGEEKKRTEKEKKANAGVVTLLLHEENFVVSKLEGAQMKVVLSDDAQKLFGKLEFTVEKNKDGKWQIVWVEAKNDEKEKPEGEDNGEEG